MNDKRNEIWKWLLQNLFALATVIVAVANLWLYSKLSPILADLKDIGGKIEALDKREAANLAEHGPLKRELLDEIKYVRSRVDKIYEIIR